MYYEDNKRGDMLDGEGGTTLNRMVKEDIFERDIWANSEWQEGAENQNMKAEPQKWRGTWFFWATERSVWGMR